MKVNVDAAIAAVSAQEGLEVVLVGREEQIKAILRKKRFRPKEIKIHNAWGVVSMDDDPLRAARDESTSIVQGLELLRRGEVDAFVSVGNTGAISAAAYLRLGTLPNIRRTPILAIFPTMAGRPTAILDVGANVDCKPEHLLQFAVLGSVYAECIMERPKPRVALLSIGEESTKGNAAVKAAHKMLSQNAERLGINFVGNIEGRDILAGSVDVIVCDGFLGNILLKYTESIYALVKTLFKKGRRISFLSLLGGVLLYPSLRRTLRDFNYAEYGGAPLLGVRGNVVVGHGISSAKAIANAVLLAQQMALANLPEAMLRATEKLEGLDNDVKDTGHRVVCAGEGAYKR